MTIPCDPPTLFKGNPWYRVPARRFHLQVVVGAPIAAREFLRDDEAPARAARRLTQWLLAHFDAGRTCAGSRAKRPRQPVNLRREPLTDEEMSTCQ